MTAHAQALAWAKHHLGEREQPPGSNTGRFVVECQRATWLGGTRWPWCVAFYMRAWEAVGHPLPWRGAGAWAFLAWARTVGWAVSVAAAVPGDAIIWRFGSGHCSMLELPPSTTPGHLQTIDGNVDDAVTRRVRPVSEALGAVHVHAKGVTHPKPPLFAVATSVSGHRKLLLVGRRSRVAKQLARLFNRYGGLTVTRRKR